MREERDTFRRDGARAPRWLGLSSATQGLVLANVGIFLVFVLGVYGVRPYLLGETELPASYAARVLHILGLVPTSAIGGGAVWQLLTYSLLHSPTRPLHLVFNMLTLYFFGREVETLYGPRCFLALYFAAAVFAGLVYCLDYEPIVMIGASGAVYAVMVTYACHYPRRRVLFFFVLPLEVRVVVAILIGLDVALHATGDGAEIAHLAHLGGAAFGLLFFALERRIGLSLDRLDRGLRRLSPHEHEEDLEARVDTLLEKISRDGIGSLSRREREFLKRASRVYRQRG